MGVYQSRARAFESEGEFFAALENYDTALVVFPTPRRKDSLARSQMVKLERDRNQCRETVRRLWMENVTQLPSGAFLWSSHKDGGFVRVLNVDITSMTVRAIDEKGHESLRDAAMFDRIAARSEVPVSLLN